MSRKARISLLGGTALLWLTAVGLATGRFMEVERQPGPEAAGRANWPANSRLQPFKGESTGLMIAHPRCPCTRASLDELADVIRRAPTPMRGYVLFLKPADLPSSWTRTTSWEKVLEIPGWIPIEDPEGEEARLFGATTSGHVFLYDPRGRLQFSGGITPGRGVRGGSVGKDSLLSFVTPGNSGITRTPVFGCPLHENPER